MSDLNRPDEADAIQGDELPASITEARHPDEGTSPATGPTEEQVLDVTATEAARMTD